MEVTTFLPGRRSTGFPVVFPPSTDGLAAIPRSTSPHPSVSSSGSEEVRCSLDELDAVIATFEDGSGKQNWLGSIAATPFNRVPSSFRKPHSEYPPDGVKRNSFIFIEKEKLSDDAADPTDYSTVTLRHPGRRSNREPPGHPVTSTSSFSAVEPEFPAPPPVETFTSDSFVLPPPPSAIKPLGTLQSNGPIYVRTSLPLQVISGCSMHSINRNPSPPRTRSSSVSPPQPAKTRSQPLSERPSVPQRAPSTRLSTVPGSPATPTPRSPPLLNRIPSKNDRLQEGTQPLNGLDDSSSDQHAVPPVNEIIRKFDVLKAHIPDKPSHKPPPQSKLPTDTTGSSYVHIFPTARPGISPPADSQPPSTDSPIQAKALPCDDGPDLNSLPTVQQLAREFAAILALPKEIVNNSAAPSSSRSASNGLGYSARAETHHAASFVVEKDIHIQSSSGSNMFSFGGCSQTPRSNEPRRQSQKSSRSVGLPEPQSSSSLARPLVSHQSTEQAIRPIHCLRLDPATLDALLQNNIVDANQIPGYQPVPRAGIPDWKLQKLERKNREAADAYAAELRKWGRMPQWKRELMEKKQGGKGESGNGVSPDVRAEQTASLLSAELTAKLQRRLEKVDSSSAS